MSILDTVVISVSALSAVFDLKIRKIPNWLIVAGVVTGLIINGIKGLAPFYASLAGLIVAMVVLILPFALGFIGAGDVKFFGVVGALLGISWLPRVFFYSALVAGSIAAVYILTGSARVALREVWTSVKLAVLSFGRVMPEPISIRSERAGGSVPWGVAFAGGTIIAYYLDSNGQWAGF